MVARSQVSGLGFEDLAFQASEIIQLFRKNYRQEISDSQAEELVRQTEGWITGLLLSSQLHSRDASIQNRAARITGVGLYEYMAQQILDQQPDPIKTFLLRTSLLDEFDAQLCQEVIGEIFPDQKIDWEQMVNFVLHHNLFVLPVGEERVFLRYHHLFRDFLRECIDRQYPNEVQAIRRRLAENYVKHGDWEPAYEIYKNLGDLFQMANLIEVAGTSMISSGKIMTLSEWINALPVHFLESRPVLLSLNGSVAVMRGDTARGEQHLSTAIKILETEPTTPHLVRAYIRRSNAFRLSGNFEPADLDVDAALGFLNKGSTDRSLYADACRAKGINLYQQGKLQNALEWLQKSHASYQSIRETRSAAYVSMEIGLISKAMGNFSTAEEAYSRALDYFNQSGNSIGQANLYNNLGVLQQILGEYDQAASSLEKAIQYAQLSGYTRIEAYGMASIADLYRELDAQDEASAAYRQAENLAVQINDRFLKLYILLAQARLAGGMKQFSEAKGLIDKAASMLPHEGAEYERNLILLEKGLLTLLEGNIACDVNELDSSTHFFFDHKYQVEAFRSALQAGLTCLIKADMQIVDRYFEKAVSILNEQENWHSFIVAGRELKDQLIGVQQVGDNTKEIIRQLVQGVEQFEAKLPAIRKQIRRRSSAIPFAPPKIIIKSLGRVQVKTSDHVVSSSDWQTQTAKELFYLLLAHPDGLTKEQIGEILWPDSSPAELKLRFKNTVYRVRHAVGKDSIILKENYYYFNYDLDYEYDVDQFLREMSNAQQADTTEKKIQAYRSAAKHFKSPYLPDVESTWVTLERERLSQIFQDGVLKLAEMLYEVASYDECLVYCQKALAENLCSEEAHRLAMKTYAALGDQASLLRQYDQCVSALEEELSIEPSPQTKNLFVTLRR
jgi:ATP/maltotriose-dependent transcriptional regulator MalT/two-component SAPR family response regulator